MPLAVPRQQVAWVGPGSIHRSCAAPDTRVQNRASSATNPVPAGMPSGSAGPHSLDCCAMAQCTGSRSECRPHHWTSRQSIWSDCVGCASRATQPLSMTKGKLRGDAYNPLARGAGITVAERSGTAKRRWRSNQAGRNVESWRGRASQSRRCLVSRSPSGESRDHRGPWRDRLSGCGRRRRVRGTVPGSPSIPPQ